MEQPSTPCSLLGNMLSDHQGFLQSHHPLQLPLFAHKWQSSPGTKCAPILMQAAALPSSVPSSKVANNTQPSQDMALWMRGFWGAGSPTASLQSCKSCSDKRRHLCAGKLKSSQPCLEPGRKEPVPQLLIFTGNSLLKLSITGLKTNMLPAYTGPTYPATGISNRLVLPGCPGEAWALRDLPCSKEKPGTSLDYGATLKPILLCQSLIISPWTRLAAHRGQELLESVRFGTTQVPSANTDPEKLLSPGSGHTASTESLPRVLDPHLSHHSEITPLQPKPITNLSDSLHTQG